MVELGHVRPGTGLRSGRGSGARAWGKGGWRIIAFELGIALSRNIPKWYEI